MHAIKTWLWNRFKEMTVVAFILMCFVMFIPSDLLVHIRALFLAIVLFSAGFSISYWLLKQDEWLETKRSQWHFWVLYTSYLMGACSFMITFDNHTESITLSFLFWSSVAFVGFDYWCILGAQSFLLRLEVNDFNKKFTSLKKTSNFQ